MQMNQEAIVTVKMTHQYLIQLEMFTYKRRKKKRKESLMAQRVE
jgi:hypothetical protein